MKVIFLQNVKNVARIGDIKDVASGYARNFLFPRNIADLATAASTKQSEELKKKHAQSVELEKQTATELATKIEAMTIELTEGANEEGHLYGSVTDKDIIAKLGEQGIHLERDSVELPEHIKTVGEHEITLDLGADVKVQLKVNIVKV